MPIAFESGSRAMRTGAIDIGTVTFRLLSIETVLQSSYIPTAIILQYVHQAICKISRLSILSRYTATLVTHQSWISLELDQGRCRTSRLSKMSATTCAYSKLNCPQIFQVEVVVDSWNWPGRSLIVESIDMDSIRVIAGMSAPLKVATFSALLFLAIPKAPV
jgi:hypothetical protein